MYYMQRWFPINVVFNQITKVTESESQKTSLEYSNMGELVGFCGSGKMYINEYIYEWA